MTSTLSSQTLCKPAHATPRNPDRPTDGGRVAVISAALGDPFMPWQAQVADVAGEKNPDGSYAYPIVVVSVPRQSGKTTLLRAVGVSRMLERPNYQVFYTAQTGKDARERWRDLVKKLRTSPLKTQTTVRQAAGSERVILPNQSSFCCFSPVESALHGYTPPLVMLDEAWAYDEQRGEELMGAIVPAQVTIAHRQLWIVSTAGTHESAYLRRWIDAGLAGQPGVALFLWAAGDADDIYDPDTWPTFHPAVGHTITADSIASAADSLPRPEFERAYGNRWTVTTSHLIPADTWNNLAGHLDPPPLSEVTLTYDVAYDRAAAAIVATWQAGDRIATKVIEKRPGTEWVAPSITAAWAANPGVTIAADDGGPTRLITEQLTDAGVPVEALNGSRIGTAFGAWMTLVESGRLAHDGDPALAAAVAGLAVRSLNDSTAPSRRHSTGDISPVVASIVGAYLADRPARDDNPHIYLPGAAS